MINLLPPEEKEKISFEKNKNLTIVLSNIVIIPLICLILILFLVNLYVLQSLNDQKSILDYNKKIYQVNNYSLFKETVVNYNSVLVKVDNFYKKGNYFTNVLKVISRIQKSKGIHLNNISVKNDREEEKFKVTIAGISDTREDLLDFKYNIEHFSLVGVDGLKKIENISFPPETLIKPSAINFNITFEINETSK